MAIKDYYNMTAEVLRPSSSTNPLTDGAVSYSTHHNIIGGLDYLSGQEQQIAGQYADSASHIYLTSTTHGTNQDDRLRIENDVYRILHIDNVFDNHSEILLEYKAVDT